MCLANLDLSFQIFFTVAFVLSFGTVIARLIFVINGNIKDDLDNTLALHINVAIAFATFRRLLVEIIPKICFLFRNKAQNEMVVQEESNKKVNPEDFSTKKKDTTEKTDDNPPSYTTICLTSEN